MHLPPCERPYACRHACFRRKTPHARIPESAYPNLFPITDPENILIDEIAALLNKNGLTSLEFFNVFEHV